MICNILLPDALLSCTPSDEMEMTLKVPSVPPSLTMTGMPSSPLKMPIFAPAVMTTPASRGSGAGKVMGCAGAWNGARLGVNSGLACAVDVHL